MLAILQTETSRTALMSANTVFQAVRAKMYETISKPDSGWQKSRSQSADGVATLNATVASPLGFVFACLGYYSSASASTTMLHPDGTSAAIARSAMKPQTMVSIDGVSFNGATFTEQGDGHAYAELWTPKE